MFHSLLYSQYPGWSGTQRRWKLLVQQVNAELVQSERCEETLISRWMLLLLWSWSDRWDACEITIKLGRELRRKSGLESTCRSCSGGKHSVQMCWASSLSWKRGPVGFSTVRAKAESERQRSSQWKRRTSFQSRGISGSQHCWWQQNEKLRLRKRPWDLLIIKTAVETD